MNHLEPYKPMTAIPWVHDRKCDVMKWPSGSQDAPVSAAVVQMPVAAFIAMAGAMSALVRKVDSLSVRISTLEKMERVSELESMMDNVTATVMNRPDYFQVAAALPEVNRLTERIFGEHFDRVEREDPEIAGTRYFTFRVLDGGEMKEVVTRYNEWHRSLCALAPSVRGMFRLSVSAKK